MGIPGTKRFPSIRNKHTLRTGSCLSFYRSKARQNVLLRQENDELRKIALGVP